MKSIKRGDIERAVLSYLKALCKLYTDEDNDSPRVMANILAFYAPHDFLPRAIVEQFDIAALPGLSHVDLLELYIERLEEVASGKPKEG